MIDKVSDSNPFKKLILGGGSMSEHVIGGDAKMALNKDAAVGSEKAVGGLFGGAGAGGDKKKAVKSKKVKLGLNN